ncbi:MAG: aldo/keto reductase [Oscillospiraceae bacterium]|nr:aldo/keto reductase [Oscillospiraceae bacterium]
MRLPKTDDQFNLPLINSMIDYFIDNGHSYFDTAYIYSGVEDLVKVSLVERYQRDAYQIATKLPIYILKSSEMINSIFNTSLKRLGADYIDVYLLHGIAKEHNDVAEQLGAWEFLSKQKCRGLIKQIGFSFHGPPEDLEEILTKHPETDVVQLQLNYIDWEDDIIQSKRLYEIARKHSKSIIVMEPIKGGLLSGDNSKASELFKRTVPDMSVASWALRFIASLDGIKVILSGMSNMEQMIDNVKTMNDNNKLSEDDIAIIQEAVGLYRSVDRIQCTRCRYCVPDCPKGINIQAIIELISDYLTYNTTANLQHMYEFFTETGNKASTCISCYSCEKRCPQNIGIVKLMAEAARLFDNSL